MPSKAVRFLSLDEVLAIHAASLRAFGGAEGVRDLGLLESALYRPQTGYYTDVAEMAAALFESLLMNHAFVDGNKRVAFFAVDVFLRLNGFRLLVEAEPAHAFLTGRFASNTADFAHLLPWLQEHMEAL